MRFSDWSADVCSSDLAILPADHQHRKFMVEGHKAFENRGMAADRFPCRVGASGAGEARLALAVIAHAHRLEDRGRADAGDRGVERGAVGDGGEGRSEEHTSELQSLMRISSAVFFLT